MALGLALGKAPGASPLIFIGAGQVTLAVLLPRVTRFDVGTNGVGATLAEGDSEFRADALVGQWAAAATLAEAGDFTGLA